MSKLPKTHKDYWKSRLKKRSYKSSEGDSKVVEEWQVRLTHRGVEKWFNLHTNNQEAGAQKAKNIYMHLMEHGWDETLAKYKPDMLVRKDDPTVGEFLAELREKTSLKEQTYQTYAKKFRTLVAGVMGIASDSSKHDTGKDGYAKWLEKIESVKLNKLTPAKIHAWKLRYVRQHENNPEKLKKAKRSVNSLIRNSKALFSPNALKFVAIRLPDPLPFEGIEMERAGKTHYKSKFSVEILVEAAHQKLAQESPEAYKVFLLALGAGLRRGEIDTLTWDQIHFDNKTISIETTEYGSPKTDGSEAEVDADEGLLNFLKNCQPCSDDTFVVGTKRKHASKSTHHTYRCNKHFKELIAWLREEGIKDSNPIHTLRKEFGSLICEQAGIFAASLQLRHSDIRITRDHYISKKSRVAVSLPGLG